MPARYLKDYIQANSQKRLLLQLVDRSPGLLSKKTRDGRYYEVQEYKWKIMTPGSSQGAEVTEGYSPKTKSGKDNFTFQFLSRIPIGREVLAFSTPEGFINFEQPPVGPHEEDFSQDPQDQQPPPPSDSYYREAQATQENFPPPPEKHPSDRAREEMTAKYEHDFKLGLAGIVQAQIAAGCSPPEIMGEPTYADRNPTAPEWVKWIRKKATDMAWEQVISDLP